MKITKLGHSCLLIEENGKKLLIDPGSWSKVTTDVIDIILITHSHSDHFDIQTIKKFTCQIFSNSEIAKELEKEGIECKVLGDSEISAQGFRIRAINATHEKLPFPMPKNTAFLINGRLLHPGDSYALTLKAEILALPIAAPWANMNQTLEFLTKINPRHIIPIHDEILSEGAKGFYAIMAKGAANSIGAKFHDMLTPIDL